MKFDKLLALVITFMIVLGTIPILLSGVSMTKRDDIIMGESYEFEIVSTNITLEHMRMMFYLMSNTEVERIERQDNYNTITTYSIYEPTIEGKTISYFRLDGGLKELILKEGSLYLGIFISVSFTDGTSKTLAINSGTDYSTYVANGNKMTTASTFKKLVIYGVYKGGLL